MSEVIAPKRPGIVQVIFMVILTIVFAVRAIRWWVSVFAGATVIKDLSTWEWVKVSFYHVAVIAGVVAIFEMLRHRAQPDKAKLDAPDEPQGETTFPGSQASQSR